MARELFKLFKYVEKHEVTDLQRLVKMLSVPYTIKCRKRESIQTTLIS